MLEARIPRIPGATTAERVAQMLRDRGLPLSIAAGPKVYADVRVGHTGDALCLLYRVVEPTVRAVAENPNDPVYEDSCVECFLAFDGQVGYYNVELSCIGVPLVGFGIGRHGRRRLDPVILGRIRTYSTLGTEPFDEKPADAPWELAAIIPLSVFAYAALRTFDGIVARANFYKCGDRLSQPHHESWAPIRTPKPDFHRPEFFAPLHFAPSLPRNSKK